MKESLSINDHYGSYNDENYLSQGHLEVKDAIVKYVSEHDGRIPTNAEIGDIIGDQDHRRISRLIAGLSRKNYVNLGRHSEWVMISLLDHSRLLTAPYDSYIDWINDFNLKNNRWPSTKTFISHFQFSMIKATSAIDSMEKLGYIKISLYHKLEGQQFEYR